MADFVLPQLNRRGHWGGVNDVRRRRGAPIHSERHVKIICIGAGASGLLFAYKLQRSFRNFDLTVYEKNKEVAGTWWENKYCACDVPAHNYTWSFEPKLDWSAVYAGSGEIFNYFDHFSKKYGLRKYCKTRHQVVGAIWNNTKGGYDVTVQNTATGEKFFDYCDILINAGGILNAWRWPAIPGLDRYNGTLLHTANWDPNVDLTGKHVGLIGNGSSGIQVLPTIQPHVRKVTTFIREPTYVSPVQGLEQHVFSPQELHDFANTPGTLLEYRKQVETGLNGQFSLFLKGTKTQDDTREYMIAQMKKKLNNKLLEDQLIPDWSLGCRRLTPGVGYLESLTKENVEVVYGGINEITEKGCLCDDGQEYPVDVLICATGFDTTFKPRFPLLGPSGTNLQDEWAKEPRSYFGVAAADFPNYLVFLGPNCPIGNGPVLSAIEVQADWMLAVIDRYQTSNIHSIAPKREAVDDFIAWKDEFMERTVWADPCRSWYKANQADAPVTALWPGSTLHYIEALSEIRWDDLEVKYNGNRFSWLGNGFSQCESDPTADWAYYIREYDDQEYQSKGRRREVLTKSGSVKRRAGAINFAGDKELHANL
ncbi:cyclohexanone monooxygenase [Exophiala aquamarina CBS 119918]|uniref:Cyclohexanone monooxygenase n=1 Tax=Exophiala aquamarina CBS 119918 TaxID=1182545 RepID=A0A072P358_9EURO|nr:cyclohexanone monooxygenase [Exophiala aquamarina CBS 119918]KEF53693.1 cyclohexanone monooxygenase [Exophiala aquamarina CBS 119918]